MKKLNTIGVMGSGRKAWTDWAEPLGGELATRNVHLLTGGGDGVMRSVSRGFTAVADRQGLSLGCIPMNLNPDGTYTPHGKYPNPYIELPVYTPLGVYNSDQPEEITRNHINVLSSDIVIALPGLGGTRNEISLAQRFNKQVLLYGPQEEFADLEDNLSRADTLEAAMSWIDAQLEMLPR